MDWVNTWQNGCEVLSTRVHHPIASFPWTSRKYEFSPFVVVEIANLLITISCGSTCAAAASAARSNCSDGASSVAACFVGRASVAIITITTTAANTKISAYSTRPCPEREFLRNVFIACFSYFYVQRNQRNVDPYTQRAPIVP